jgi:hypothetical protein
MCHRTRTALVCLVVSIVTCIACGTAGANTALQVSERYFTATFAGLSLIGDNGSRITCRVTLDGSFESANIGKTIGARRGEVTRATFANCSGGYVVPISGSLPWRIHYQGFTGTLPNINSFRLHLVDAGIRIEVFYVIVFICLAITSVERPLGFLAFRESMGNLITLMADPTGAIPLREITCAAEEGTISGSGEIFEQGSSTRRIRMTLA